jgi:GntR family transcriptional regulator/MocR family aminotransferase
MRRPSKSSNGYQIIYERFKTSIEEGTLRPGQRIPSIRALAEELGVAKRTVEWAFELLNGEGYIDARGARGSFVSAMTASRPRMRKVKPKPLLPDPPPKRSPFQPGVPAFDAFPLALWRRLGAEAARRQAEADLPLPGAAGYRPLREAIASYVAVSRGFSCAPEQIFITSGYPDSLSLLARAMALKNEKVVVEDPGYFRVPHILNEEGVAFTPSRATEEGFDKDYFLTNHSDAKALLLTPSHHSPFASSLSLEARRVLCAWAGRENAWIIEDDYDGEFHYERKLLPAMKAEDSSDRVIYLGSFSKTVLPSLRLGYIVAPTALQPALYRAAEHRSGPAIFPQQHLARFLAEGHFLRHLKKMRGLYAKRRAMVVRAIETVFPDELRVLKRDGGLMVPALLKKPVNDRRIAAAFRERGIMVPALSEFRIQESSEPGGLLFGFTNVRSEEEAVTLLGQAKGILKK